jgi:hypothetical protein
MTVGRRWDGFSPATPGCTEITAFGHYARHALRIPLGKVLDRG